MARSSFDYGVNDLGQRDDVDVSGTAFVAPYTRGFKYDAKGQVVRDDHSTDNAKDRAFEFDGIGNRSSATMGIGASAVTTTYASNSLNQLAAAGGDVRSHDDDGNLVDDGVKTYVWDGENRLLSVSLHGGQADSSGVLVSYTYDYLSRRISKNETNGLNVTFIYDRWNPVAVYGGSGLSKTYTWGMDLSGSMQGAGGVGGLLAVKEASGGDSYYPTYDGNGNVSEYLDSSGAVVAHYEYDAFGRTTVSSGVMKDDFVHRFSTKQLDLAAANGGASGLYYYGYRYYQPEVGRWLGRDPIGERGGENIFCKVYNNIVNLIDVLGREPRFINVIPRQDSTVKKGDPAVQKNLKSKTEQLVEAFNKALERCCKEYEIGCKCKVRIALMPISVTGIPQEPADGDYGLRDPEVNDAIGKRDGNNIDLTFTGATIRGGDVGAIAGFNTGVLINMNGNAPFIPNYILAHEVGHSVGYRGNDPRDTAHDIDSTPNELDVKDDSIMGPNGGLNPTKQWCEKTSAIAK